MQHRENAGRSPEPGATAPDRAPQDGRLGRRDFLLATSASLVAAITLPGRSEAGVRGPGTSGPLPIQGLPVGYWSQSDKMGEKESPNIPFRPDVITAIGLMPDETLVDEVHVTVHGLVPVAARPAMPVQVYADFPIQSPTGPAMLKYYAWFANNTPQAVPAGPTSFLMPLQGGAVTLTLEHPGSPNAATPKGSAPAPSQTDYRFVTAPFTGMATLRAGVYFLPLTVPGAPAPDWSRYQFRPVARTGAPLGRQLLQKTAKGIVPADFDYLVLSFAS